MNLLFHSANLPFPVNGLPSNNFVPSILVRKVHSRVPSLFLKRVQCILLFTYANLHMDHFLPFHDRTGYTPRYVLLRSLLHVIGRLNVFTPPNDSFEPETSKAVHPLVFFFFFCMIYRLQ